MRLLETRGSYTQGKSETDDVLQRERGQLCKVAGDPGFSGDSRLTTSPCLPGSYLQGLRPPIDGPQRCCPVGPPFRASACCIARAVGTQTPCRSSFQMKGPHGASRPVTNTARQPRGICSGAGSVVRKVPFHL